MTKRIFCFLITIMIMLCMSTHIFASEPSNGNNDTVNYQGPDSSMQILFAKLQLEMADINKQQAMDKMNHIADIQKEQKSVAALLNTARQCMTEAASKNEKTKMPADMAEYLKYDTARGDLLTSEEWNTVVISLENRLNELSVEVQQEMLYVQNYMGQYNSYLQGANTYNPDTNQTLTSLARGQSMYGDSDVGIAITCLVVGLVLGCTVTLAAQNIRRQKDK